MALIEIRPRGPFSLAAAQSFAGGFPAGIGGGEVGPGSITLRMAWTRAQGGSVSYRRG